MDTQEVHAVVSFPHPHLVHGSLVSGQPGRGAAMEELVPQPSKTDEANESEKDNQETVDVVKNQVVTVCECMYNVRL